MFEDPVKTSAEMQVGANGRQQDEAWCGWISLLGADPAMRAVCQRRPSRVGVAAAGIGWRHRLDSGVRLVGPCSRDKSAPTDLCFQVGLNFQLILTESARHALQLEAFAAKSF